VSTLAAAGPPAYRMSAPEDPGPAHTPARVYLAPGRLYASDEDVQVTTILGSCVSVCIWDAQAQVGGLNHFLLPSGSPASPRFGDSAVALLIGRLLELGAQRGRLTAKAFGGACVLEAFRADEWSLGARNVEMAREQLAAAAIPVVGEDVGGDLGRKLVFHVRTGAAWVRPIEMKG
jgi:chemotaxis protein CheD